MPITLPEDSYANIQNLIRLSDTDFNALVDALKKVKPSLSPDTFSTNVAALMPQNDSVKIEGIVSEIFAMDIVRDDKDFSIDEFAELVRDKLQQTKSEAYTFTKEETLIFETRIKKVFEVRKTIGISSKALDLLTDQSRVFYSCKIVTDIRPVFNDDGSAIEASIIIHNLRIHFGQDNDHKDFYVTLDSRDIQNLRAVLDRAELKAEYLKTLLESSGVSYLDLDE